MSTGMEEKLLESAVIEVEVAMGGPIEVLGFWLPWSPDNSRESVKLGSILWFRDEEGVERWKVFSEIGRIGWV